MITRTGAKVPQEAIDKARAEVRAREEVWQRLKGESPPAPVDLTRRQLRRRGYFGGAALLTDQGALAEKDPVRRSTARAASSVLKQLANEQPRLFDWFGGNVSTSDDYFDTVWRRLKATDMPGSTRRTAWATLGMISRHLNWEDYTCKKFAPELAEMLDMDNADMRRTLRLLEQIGAISRVKRGQFKVICLPPDGVYRGKVENHAKVAARFNAEVVPFPQAKGQPVGAD